MEKFTTSFIKSISLGLIAWVCCLQSLAQYSESTNIRAELINIEKDTSLSVKTKLQHVLFLKKRFNDIKLEEDSVYARILHRIGLYEYVLNNKVATNNAITSTLAAVRINSAGKKNSAAAFCVNSYNNLAVYYESLRMYYVAGKYFDSAIIWRKQFHVPEISELKLLHDKAQMLYRTGDYEKAIEQFNIAISKARESQDSSGLLKLLNQRAQANYIENHLEQALTDINLASNFPKEFGSSELLNTMVIKAKILAKQKDFSKALFLFDNAISQRLLTTEYIQISDDYTDLGNFYLNDLHDYTKARNCYLNTISYALKADDFERLSKGHINLEQLSFKLQKYKDAEDYCIKALKDLKVTVSNDILSNPSSGRLSAVGNKELILAILGNKTELLLQLFTITKDKKYLSACLQTALLSDTLITNIRHLQLGEKSKLYWRDRTREFFTQAIDACFLANDSNLAFYFMEKSRAVLLNDKLNELGASSQLPQAEAGKEREFQIAVISEQQKLNTLTVNSIEYDDQFIRLLETKEKLERYIKSLEKNYPTYYQYKYADKVPLLSALQKQLLQNNQNFVHYFMNDTVAYILGITPANTVLIKQPKDNFNSRLIMDFLRLCSSEPTLNNQYALFAGLSNSLYNILFRPLNIPPGKVVICPDNYLLPLEALCTDRTGNNFLIHNYVFSYVFSARVFMKAKPYNPQPAKGDFIGFAPVSFEAYPGMPDLKLSADALKKSGQYYNNAKLFTKQDATRHNFISAVSGYSIVNVFSHAQADTLETEPVLYMHDSMINLSALQLIHNPATKLVVLSACQTNIGKNARGEGIFSMARGFASVGIPAVAATLWKADEQSIYAISAKFHDYLSQGLPKDEALRQAKLYFIQYGHIENPFPYYWANMILVGNEKPVNFSEKKPLWPAWWWIPSIIFISIVIVLINRFRRRG